MRTQLPACLAAAMLAAGTALITANASSNPSPIPVDAGPVDTVHQGAKFLPREVRQSDQEGIFAVLLEDAPLAAYRGGVAGIPEPPRKAGGRPDFASPAAREYRARLHEAQEEFMGRASEALQRRPDVVHRYATTLNGLALRTTGREAARLARLPGVDRVIMAEDHAPLTDAGPQWISADAIWSDPEGLGIETAGEGVIVGIIDTGISPEHPSFAAQDPSDGFVHSNPFGSGSFVGVCDPDNDVFMPTFACNDKLVGAWYFLDRWDDPGERAFDENGHGTHVAATAAGNRVNATHEGIDFALSGVAPRANIISYRVCGGPDTLCNSADSAAAIEQSIEDGVDVLNFSIGGGASPATDLASQAFLNATEAGVFVSASAGNSGPGAETVSHRGAWMTTVANLTHNRMIAQPVSVTGPGAAPGDLQNLAGIPGTGPAFEQDADAVYRYAGHVDPGNSVGCVPFPAGSFEGEIALIIRGDCPFADKADNATDAGAEAMVVFNSAPGLPITMGGLEDSLIPAVMVSLADGEALVDWAAAHSDPTLHIGAQAAAIIDDATADIMRDSSSRGPAPGALGSVLKPDVGAPGVAILAADLDQFGGFGTKSGTSMSAPHNAGSGALLRALNPDWSPLEIKSALMMTAIIDGVVKEDGQTPVDPFDVGGGRIDVFRASRSGLVLHESRDNFDAAYGGGDLSSLNMASFAHHACDEGCAWTRELRSVLDSGSSWTASVNVHSPGLDISLAESAFSVAAGDSFELSVTADTSAMDGGDTAFFDVVLSETGGLSPDLRLVGVVQTPPPPPELAEGRYFVTDRKQDAACAAPFANVGGYADLGAFGISIQPVEGDTISFTGFSTGNPIHLHGGFFSQGITFTDDGFGFLDWEGLLGTGDMPWVHRPIPSAGDPSNLVAPLWHDWVIVRDPAENRGVRLAVSGQTWVIAEFAGVEPFQGDGRIDHQVAMRRSPAMTPGVYDIIFAYNNVETDNHISRGATIGVENYFGDDGAQYAHNESRRLGPIDDGFAVCMAWVEQVSEPEPTVEPGEYRTPQRIGFDVWPRSASIRYTTDGSEPTPEHGQLLKPGDSFMLRNSATVRAIAFWEGTEPSEVIEAEYIIQRGRQ